jgi:hypothetical protein
VFRRLGQGGFQVTRRKLEALVRKHTHRDFKGGKGADRTILAFVSGIGTCQVWLSKMTDSELLERLPKSVRESLGSIPIPLT